MTKTEAVFTLESCKPVYFKLQQHRYTLTCEDQIHLKQIRLVFESGLIDDPEVLQAAHLDYDDAAMLVGYAFIDP